MKYIVPVMAALGGLFFGFPAQAEDDFAPCIDAVLPGLAGSLCAVSKEPIRPDEPSGETVDLFVRKFPAASGARTGEIWLIAGGPGESGASLYPFLDTFRRAFPDRDLLIPDHRGTGFSSRLCPVEEAVESPGGTALTGDEWGPCIGVLFGDVERAHAFTITNASHDLSQLITRHRGVGSVQVYGVSYGTQLILRMMQAAPLPLDGIILDGLIPAESSPEWDLSHRTVVVDEVGRRLLNPAQEQVYRDLLDATSGQQSWVDLVPGRNLRQFLGSLLNFPELRDRIPTVLDGLSSGDTSQLVQVRAELETAIGQLGQYPQSPAALPLVILMNASENNGRRDLTAEVVEAEAQDALFTSPLPKLLVGPPAPLYERDSFYGRSPVALPRTLVIHGTLDPNTPYEGAVAHASELAKAGDVTFATVVEGAHMLSYAASNCFIRLVSAFDAQRDVPEACSAGVQDSEDTEP